jgi:ribosomal protein S18 acetylase RimI-like enzyme
MRQLSLQTPVIRKIKKNELVSIGKLHKEVYGEEHFTSTFYLHDLIFYYLFLLTLNSAYSRVCLNKDGKMLGFAISRKETGKAIKNFVKQRFLRVCFYLVTNPKFFLKKVFSFYSRIGQNNFKSAAVYRLLSIAVSKDMQGQGVGKALIQATLESLPEGKSLGLSVKKKNKRAIAVYEKLGFSKEHETPDAIYYIINNLKNA